MLGGSPHDFAPSIMRCLRWTSHLSETCIQGRSGWNMVTWGQSWQSLHPGWVEENLHCFGTTNLNCWAFTGHLEIASHWKTLWFSPMDTSWRRQLQSFKLQWRLKPQTQHSTGKGGNNGKISVPKKKVVTFMGIAPPTKRLDSLLVLVCRYILFAACSW